MTGKETSPRRFLLPLLLPLPLPLLAATSTHHQAFTPPIIRGHDRHASSLVTMSSSPWPSWPSWPGSNSQGGSSPAKRGGGSVSRQDYVSLGGLKVSPMGVGTWAWGNRFLWGYSKEDDEELQRVFDYVVSQGLNWFDTADSYGTGDLEGQSEKLLGKFIREYSGGRGANDVLIATKIAPYPFRVGKGSMINAMRGSTRRLKRGGGQGVDIGQLHWAPPLGWQEQAYWEGLAELYRNQEIRAIGLSNYGPQKLRQAKQALQEAGADLASNQVQFSLVSSTVAEKSGLLETAEELGVRLIAYSPLGLGLLTGRYTEERLPQGPRRVLFKELLPELRPVLQVMEEIKRARPGVTYSQIALNWCRGKGTVPIVGLKTMAQAEENLGALSWKLKPAELEELDRASRSMKKQTLQNIFQSE